MVTILKRSRLLPALYIAAAVAFSGYALPLSGAEASGSLGSLLAASAKSDGFLPPDQAFRVAATAESPGRVRLSWAIAPGYYLYKARLKFATTRTAHIGSHNRSTF